MIKAALTVWHCSKEAGLKLNKSIHLDCAEGEIEFKSVKFLLDGLKHSYTHEFSNKASFLRIE